MGSYFRDFYAPKATEQPTIGDTKFSVINNDHMGWMNCDGRILSTEDYPLLFRVLNYSFGGSSNQFRLPDMRSRVPGAIGQGVGLTNRALGSNVGEETHILTIAEMPSHNHGTNASDSNVGNNLTGTAGLHTHTINDPGHTHTYLGVQSQGVASGLDNAAENSPRPTETTSSNTTGITINSNGNHQHSIATQGGDDPHNNMQPTLFIGNMFIYSGKLHSGASKWRYALDTNIL